MALALPTASDVRWPAVPLTSAHTIITDEQEMTRSTSALTFSQNVFASSLFVAQGAWRTTISRATCSCLQVTIMCLGDTAGMAIHVVGLAGGIGYVGGWVVMGRCWMASVVVGVGSGGWVARMAWLGGACNSSGRLRGGPGGWVASRPRTCSRLVHGHVH